MVLEAAEHFEAWDPLDAQAGIDPGLLVSAQRREISNILKSYTGYYDLFAELLQNALDAVERRSESESDPSYQGRVQIRVSLIEQTITVTDNGCGMSLEELRSFLRPNFSFKGDGKSRGYKGVGATYLGYGFNSLRVTTRGAGAHTFSGRIERGREWVDDRSGTVARPKIVSQSSIESFEVDQGTAVEVRLTGKGIRPRDLGWSGATTASQWLVLLRLLTPIGGIYLCGQHAPNIKVEIEVVDGGGKQTKDAVDTPSYLFPHTVIPNSGSLSAFIADQKRRADKGQDLSVIPASYTKLNGLWGEWTGAQILGDVSSDCPIRPRLTAKEQELARELDLRLYGYLAFSTDLWDSLNDSTFRLRRGARVMRGGLQLATKHMPQGMSLTIPMTNNVGFQNLAHIIIHFENAEPDLGRKGFQPEHVQLAEKIAVSAVTAFRRRYHLLKKPGVAPIFGAEVKLQDWIRDQENHEKAHGLTISGKGLFMPAEELPIRSEPVCEQDVVALFNQMLSSGLIRGVQLISSSQYKQYDGLFRIRMDEPFDRFVVSDANPLGLDPEHFAGCDEALVSPVKVLEYKHNLDGLVEEIQSEVKSAQEIGLAVAWKLGGRWDQMFDVVSLLDPDNAHHRHIHGSTHRLVHSTSGLMAFDVIILEDLISYLQDPDAEIERQRKLVSA